MTVSHHNRSCSCNCHLFAFRVWSSQDRSRAASKTALVPRSLGAGSGWVPGMLGHTNEQMHDEWRAELQCWPTGWNPAVLGTLMQVHVDLSFQHRKKLFLVLNLENKTMLVGRRRREGKVLIFLLRFSTALDFFNQEKVPLQHHCLVSTGVTRTVTNRQILSFYAFFLCQNFKRDANIW